MFGGFTFERDGANTKHIAKALLKWGWLEVTEGWRSWFVSDHAPQPTEIPLPRPAPQAPV
jgi:hypothetical protein